jgi:hypothetical protein
MLPEFSERSDAIEECYEFMLAYAGQGLPSDEGSQKSSQVRDFLQRAAKALTGLAGSCARAVAAEELEPAGKYMAFIAVLDRDAQSSLSALELVLAQPSISSQLIDNLNASIHLRALLTDLFVIGEILREQHKRAVQSQAE